MKLNLPNLLTCSRMVFGLLLLPFEPFSAGFYVFFTLGILSDMADGFAARRLNVASALGAVLDSVADLVFFALCLFRIAPAAEIPRRLWGIAAGIALLRLGNICLGYRREKRLIFLHTRANKLTGCLLMVLPFAAMFTKLSLAAIPVCAFALFATVQETCLILAGRTKC